MLLAGRPAGQIAALLEEALARARPAVPRTGIRGRRCCGCWSWPSASPRSTSRSGRCWPRSTAAVRRAAWWRPTAPSAWSSCGSARCPRPTRRPGWRCTCCRKVTSRRGSGSRRPSWPTSPSRPASWTRRRRCWICCLSRDGPRGRDGAHPGGPRTPAAGSGPGRRGAGRLPGLRGACSAPTCGACPSARPVTCTRAPAPRSRWCGWASRQRARQLAEAELADMRVFGTPRALGIALRVAGLARGGKEGLALLHESVATLDDSPALLERAHSLAELGAALRRYGQRDRGPGPAGPGAGARRPLRRRAAGRPGPRRAEGDRRPPAAPVAHRRGRADPQRAARRPAGRRRPLQPRDRLRAVRDPQGDRGPPGPRVRQARDRGPRPAGPRPGEQKKTRVPTLQRTTRPLRDGASYHLTYGRGFRWR